MNGLGMFSSALPCTGACIRTTDVRTLAIDRLSPFTTFLVLYYLHPVTTCAFRQRSSASAYKRPRPIRKALSCCFGENSSQKILAISGSDQIATSNSHIDESEKYSGCMGNIHICLNRRIPYRCSSARLRKAHVLCMPCLTI